MSAPTSVPASPAPSAARAYLPMTRPEIDDETIAGVAEVLRSGWITSGPQVKAFEAELSAYCGGRPARVFNSGTCTMEIALRVAGIGPGHEVITTPLSWVATSNVILAVGAKPVFVDIDPATRNLDLERVEAAITPATRAILPVDLAGLPVDRDRLHALAARHRLRVVEDAAQSFGSAWSGRRIGSFGDFVSFSFHPNKNITTIEGGCLVLPDERAAKLAEQYRLQGVVRSGYDGMEVEVLGGKFNLTDVAARVGRGQLKHLEGFTAKRRELARAYFRELRDAGPARPRPGAAGRRFRAEQLAHVPGDAPGGAADAEAGRGHGPPARAGHRHGRALPGDPPLRPLPAPGLEGRRLPPRGVCRAQSPHPPALSRHDGGRRGAGRRRAGGSPRGALEIMSAPSVQVSVVIPVYNEEPNLPALFARLYPVLDRLGRSYEVIFTNDGSEDRSFALLCAQHALRPEVTRVIDFNSNYGQHMAIMAAFERVRGEVIVTLDADLQNPPEEIPKLLAKVDEGFDYVGGYRLKRQDTVFRKIASRLINFARERTTSIEMTDQGCMLRAYRRPLVDAVVRSGAINTFIPALAYTFASRPAEVGVEHADRNAGVSN